jgi:class 3 adenylate cyclase
MNPNQISPTPPEEGQAARRIDGKSGLSLDLSPGQAEGWEALARHLSSPGKRETEDLPEKFGMAPELVTEVIKGLEHRPTKELPWVAIGRLLVSGLKEVYEQLRSVFRKWTDRPLAFLIVSLTLLFLLPYLTLLSKGFFSRGPQTNINFDLSGSVGFGIIFMLGVISLAFYRWGTYRFLGSAALLLFLGFQPFSIFISSSMPGSQFAAYVVSSLASLVPVAFFIGIFAAFAFAGSWVALQKEDRREDRLSRQEMLDRLFTLESRLKAMPREAFSGHRLSLRERTRRSALFPYYAVFFGLGFGLVEVLSVAALSRLIPAQPEALELTRGLTRTIFGLLGILGAGFLGFYTGGVWRSLIAAVIAVGGSLLAILTPIPPFGLEVFRETAASQSFAIWAAGSIALAVFGGGAGVIDGRTARRRKARANDPAALLSEVILLRRRLQADQQTIVVMAVDVARSTMLKQDQDPLDVEFSFREYQKLVAEVAKQCGGEVFSEAGDGALASFRDASQALRAARLLQAHIQTFNAITNRLTGDFRLRIGMHAGEAQAGFADVPYHELIDIAAHVESAAPVGGIAVTSDVRRLLPDEEMAEVAAQVDGHPVWIILKPILFE